MKKILAVIVNYGDEQLNYLEQVVHELKSFIKYDVTVIVNHDYCRFDGYPRGGGRVVCRT